MTIEVKNLVIYIAKCVTGCIVVFFLAWLLDYRDISWCIISVMLVLTPESNEAVTLAFTRIKSNLVAGASSLLCLLFLPASPYTIIFVIIITIIACYKLKIMAGSRAAIAAVIIIMLHGLESSQPNFWNVTLERIGAVVAGCIIGLLITLIYHREFWKKASVKGRSDEG